MLMSRALLAGLAVFVAAPIAAHASPANVPAVRLLSVGKRSRMCQSFEKLKLVEAETQTLLRCADSDVTLVSGAKNLRVRTAKTTVVPFYAEGLDMHCGLAVITAAGAFVPDATAMFGCGSQRSKSDWDSQQASLTATANGVVTWVVHQTQRDPMNARRVSKTTDVVVCRDGALPACATIHRAGHLTAARALRGTRISWP